jgi:hypothetical protein
MAAESEPADLEQCQHHVHQNYASMATNTEEVWTSQLLTTWISHQRLSLLKPLAIP